MKIEKEIKKWKNFMMACIALAIFFGLEYFHAWANTTLIKLHFCEHIYCMIFAAIFVVIAFMSWKKKKHYFKTALIILGVGLILMNVTNCENGNMYLGDFAFGSIFNYTTIDTHTECKPGVDCAGDIVEVPIPPCLETDDGRDYITFGTVLSGVNLDDICMGNFLRERYCNAETTYTSEDIDCTTFGADWICEEGECRESEVPAPPILPGTETDCGDGIDNDGDGLIDCADSDCADTCGIFEYSCQHLSTYPTCGGTCPPGEECVIYNAGDGTLDGGWCECMPEEETSCYESGSCEGWCLDGDICVGDSFGCYCVYNYGFSCQDSDGGDEPTIPGTTIVYSPGYSEYPDVCTGTDTLEEYFCGEEYIGIGAYNCTELLGTEAVCSANKFGEGYCEVLAY